MSHETKITLARGGSKKATLPISEVVIPDLRDIALAICENGKVEDGPASATLILQCWQRANSLKRHIIEN